MSLLATAGAGTVLPEIIAAMLPEYLSGLPILNVLLLATWLGCAYWIPGIMLSAKAPHALLMLGPVGGLYVDVVFTPSSTSVRSMMMWALFRLMNGIQRLTGLPQEQLFRGQPPKPN
jgi:hypothetical protein